MSGKNTTISSSQPMAGNLRIQTAVYGSVIPLVYGRTRISGNLIWYGGFQAIPHTSTTTSGGKGGGKVKQTQTDYTYTAALMLALGEGVMNNVLSAWRGKARYSGVPGGATRVSTSHTAVVPGSPFQITVPSTWAANIQVSDTRPEPYDYYQQYEPGIN